jgi:hypothetical protein
VRRENAIWIVLNELQFEDLMPPSTIELATLDIFIVSGSKSST